METIGRKTAMTNRDARNETKRVHSRELDILGKITLQGFMKIQSKARPKKYMAKNITILEKHLIIYVFIIIFFTIYKYVTECKKKLYINKNKKKNIQYLLTMSNHEDQG